MLRKHLRRLEIALHNKPRGLAPFLILESLKMTNTNTLVDNTLEKPDGYNLKTRIEYMLTHLTSAMITMGCLVMGLHYQNSAMIIFNMIMTIFNAYFFFRHYNKLIDAIEKLPNLSFTT